MSAAGGSKRQRRLKPEDLPTQPYLGEEESKRYSENASTSAIQEELAEEWWVSELRPTCDRAPRLNSTLCALTRAARFVRSPASRCCCNDNNNTTTTTTIICY
jgi:hypothetical protein